MTARQHFPLPKYVDLSSSFRNLLNIKRFRRVFIRFLKTESAAGLCRAYSSKIFRDRPSQQQPVSIPHPAGESIKSSIASGKNQHIDTQEMPAASAAFSSISVVIPGALRSFAREHRSAYPFPNPVRIGKRASGKADRSHICLLPPRRYFQSARHI